MLTIYVIKELYDEAEEQFIEEKIRVDLEHSLVSLSKWESIHEKPFLGRDEKTPEEILSYVECMILAPEDSPEIVYDLSEADFRKINEYIEAKRSATTFPDTKAGPSREIITSELIYYWMVAYNIPFECENWHLSRLLTLVRICNIKNQSPKKMSKGDMLRQRRELNAQRRSQYGTSG
jgi:hypothetical protein